jgi:hypothetical protein
MFLFKRRYDKRRYDKRKKEMYDRLISIIPSKISIVSFEYYPKIFGNIVVELESHNCKHRFFTDRGEIYHNTQMAGENYWKSKMCCDSSYMYFEKENTFQKLLQVIKQELNI